MTVKPRLCFACSYLTMFAGDNPFRVQKACHNIKDKCCMNKRPNREKVDRRAIVQKLERKNDMLSRRFLI